MARGKMTEKVMEKKHQQYASSNDREMKIRVLEKHKEDTFAPVQNLRPSYTTHIVESDVDLRNIKAALGHSSPKFHRNLYLPGCRLANLTDTNKFRMQSPLDALDIV